MPTTRTRKFIEEAFNNVEEKQILLATCDVYDTLEPKETITIDELEPIVNAARNKHMGVWQIGADFLWKLAIKHEVAREAIRNLITSKKVNERLQIIACIRKGVSVPFCKEIILTAIADKKGKRVREKAAQAFKELNLKELVPIFEDALDREQDDQTKKSIEMYLGLVRDGYVLKASFDNKLSLGFPTKKGGICFITVSHEEVKTEEMIKDVIDKRRD
ncbi:hypothetical protein GC093_34845 [Paenibacillus sp. LMG 31456]|uniref:HEAT repeat domain-containing protein n=1 Tax=Paenibacillus foliorum TaxID=2654974 RepID=A0A972K410_9BACL|nr:hypothetical protein [Paenibacillus foliorum]NOU98361.1 hypothetical protein [Paenibacillus foliorum]